MTRLPASVRLTVAREASGRAIRPSGPAMGEAMPPRRDAPSGEGGANGASSHSPPRAHAPSMRSSSRSGRMSPLKRSCGNAARGARAGARSGSGLTRTAPASEAPRQSASIDPNRS